MIAAAIEKILSLQKPPTFKVEGRNYFAGDEPVLEPSQKELTFATLTGLVGYHDAELKDSEKWVFAHVKSPNGVYLEGEVFGAFKQRQTYAQAIFNTSGEPFRFGHYYDVESFIINLQAHFVQTETVYSILRLVGNIKDEKVKTVQDDGYTQTVNSKTGVALVQQSEVPNPVNLCPYRTFLEVDQPEISCVLRLRSGREGNLPDCALFEADGGLWKLTAMQSIKEWLTERLPANVPILA